MKTILVTGASTGIGRAAVLKFHEEGWSVAATMRDPAAEKEFWELDNVTVLPLDVTDRESIISAVTKTIEHFDGLDVLLNNAGYGLMGALEAVEPEQLERQFATNVFGPVYAMQACLPHFRSRKAGVIINVSSIGGRVALPFNSLYHGTKFGLEGISESLAQELAPHGIRVKIVEPGGVLTDFAGRSLDRMHKEGLLAYDASLQGVMSVLTDPARRTRYSHAAAIADVIFAAATDGSNRLRYLAGADAEAMYAERQQLSDEEYLALALERFRLMP